MRIDIVTLFPELCDSFLSASILGRARAKNLFEAHCHQIRDYTKNKQKQTDDYPYGGGCGMVLYAQPIADCLRAVQAQCAAQGRARPHVVFLTAAGRPYNEEKARELAGYDAVTLVCGHYEGIDQRVIDAFGDEEISIGDYVLTGGELASLVVADSVLRLQPGVLAEEKGYQDESYWDGLLEYPQFTRPEVWEGRAVPPVLLTGDHKKIDEWRGAQSRERTRERRPDLYDAWCESHPLTELPKWKRGENMRLVKNDEQLKLCAALMAEGRRTVCAPVCDEEYLEKMTPDFWLPDLTDEKKNGWAFYLHEGRCRRYGRHPPQNRRDRPSVCDRGCPRQGVRCENAGLCPQKAAGARPPDDGGHKHEYPRHRAVQADGLAADGHSAAPLRPRRGRHLCSGIL